MGEWIDWLTSTPQGQFLLGVAGLIFGSQAILSEDNLKGKLWGLGAPARWFKRRQKKAAEEEVEETKRLRELTEQQHRYIVWITAILRTIEVWAADNGHELPPPPFMTFNEWTKEKEEEEGGE